MQFLLRGVFLLLLMGQAASASTSTNAQFRGLWVPAWFPGIKSEAEIKELVATARNANFNALIVQVRKRGDAYYNSKYEPKAEEIDPAFDPLGELIKQAHDTNAGPRLEIHAWIVVYPVSTQIKLQSHPAPIPRGDLIPGHPYTRHKEWLSPSITGETFDGKNYWFDPGVPEVQDYLWKVATDITQNYDVDGLSLDYIHYHNQESGYHTNAIARFNAQYDRKGKPATDDPEWQQFRRDQVTDLVRKIYLTTIAEKPHVKISACSVTGSARVEDADSWKKSFIYRDTAQDWVSWMREGIVDINMPMNFLPQMSGEFAAAYFRWNAFLRKNKYDRHLTIGCALFYNTGQSLLTQTREALKIPYKQPGADGIVFYSYAVPGEFKEPQSTSKFLEILHKPGNLDLSPVFKDAAPTPDMPWKSKPATGHLKGFARNERKVSLQGADISLTGPVNRRLRSDATGFYGTVDLPPGEYQLIAKFSQHQSVTNDFKIQNGTVSTVDIRLIPQK